MIMNERQYRISKATLERFRAAVQELAPDAGPGTHEEMQAAALRGQLATIECEIRDYEELRSGRRRAIEVDSLARLPELLVASRIARGWTHRQLAEAVGLREQVVQRYEATSYESASLGRILDIFEALAPERVRVRVELPRPTVLEARRGGVSNPEMLWRPVPTGIAAAEAMHVHDRVTNELVAVSADGAARLKTRGGQKPGVLRVFQLAGPPLLLDDRPLAGGRWHDIEAPDDSGVLAVVQEHIRLAADDQGDVPCAD